MSSATGPAIAGRPGEVEFEDHGEGRFVIRGDLSFSTAVTALEKSKGLFATHSCIELDLEGVRRADSAGLALMLEWVNWARNSRREIHFSNIPAQITAIAQISEVEDMLHRAERWTGA
ncbi:MAG: STAS domain-containing protein [Candidatus Loosdrechtia sp.]|uniref:STAS domain-containing protein n=1 Tax=Candidatus Loosdrechtia sp. TaxID=3101272 RepID=UPI00403AD6E0